MAEKTNYHHGDLRQALIEAAIALIGEQEVGSLSLREVARRVGVSHAAPYRHFANKEALLAAVAQQGFEGLTEALQRGLAKTTADPVGSLSASGVAYVEWAIAHPSHYRVMFGTSGERFQTYPDLEVAANGTFMVLVEAIAAGQAAGVLQAGEPRQLARVAWSLVHGLAMLAIDSQIKFTSQQELRSLAEFATQSLAVGWKTG